MPWKKSEPMEQRTEFALKALRTGNFRELCQEYGISAKPVTSGGSAFYDKGSEGWRNSRGGHRASSATERRRLKIPIRDYFGFGSRCPARGGLGRIA